MRVDTRRAAQLILAAILLVFVAERTAVAARKGGRPFWRFDGEREAATQRAALALLDSGPRAAAFLLRCGSEADGEMRARDGCTREPLGSATVMAASLWLFEDSARAFRATRLVTLACVLAAVLLFLRQGERHVWGGHVALTPIVALCLLGPPVLRDWSLGVSGQAYGSAGVLLGLALGLSAPQRRLRAGLAAGGLGALAAIFASPGSILVCLTPFAGGLLTPRRPLRRSLLLALLAALGWASAEGTHLALAARALGRAQGVADTLGPSSLADVSIDALLQALGREAHAAFWIGPIWMLLLGLWSAGAHPERPRRRTLMLAQSVAALGSWGAAALACARLPPALSARHFLLAHVCLLAALAATAAGLCALPDRAARARHSASLRPLWVMVCGVLALAGVRAALALPPDARASRLAILVLSLAGLGVLVVLLARGAGPLPSAQEGLRNGAVAGASLLALLLVLEIAFMHVPRSHGVGYTLAARLWAKYLRPFNARNYRDPEYTADRIAKPHKVVVVGDSFAEGAGVRDVRDRFANVLGALLPADHEVFVLAQGGVDTADELRFLERFPWTPRVIVLSYYANDIEGRAGEQGLVFRGFAPYADVPARLSPLVRRSYLVNFFYWLFPHSDADAYRAFLLRAYASEAVLRAHERDLDRIVGFARERRAALVVVLFPFMNDVSGSRFFLERIERRLTQQQVPVVNVARLVAGWPQGRLVANRHDPHPSIAVHRQVGQTLHSVLVARGLVPVVRASSYPCRSPGGGPTP